MKQFLGKVKFWMDKFLSIACAVLLSFMTILVLIQVFSRYVLNSPVAFTEELVRYSLIWTGFIGAAYAFSTREHMSLTLVRDKFTGKAHTALLVPAFSSSSPRSSTFMKISPAKKLTAKEGTEQ